jgi:1,4-alpha-glucan branching enzyme
VESSDVAVYGREAKTGLQVWSAAYGYPGDFAYREFHRKDNHSGLQYWRITGVGIGLGDKDYYDPVIARGRGTDHANHFVSLVENLVADYRRDHDTPGIIVSTYDTELFGHWWFEGIDWLKDVLRLLEKSKTVGLANARGYLADYPPDEMISLPESSWGLGGGHWTWENPETEWMWPIIHQAEMRMERIVEEHPRASGVLLAFLKQASRELTLLEASDWPFLITTGQATEYASARFQQHLARFDHLAAIIESGSPTEEDLRVLHASSDMDNPFPSIDYRSFKPREQKVDLREMELSAQ